MIKPHQPILNQPAPDGTQHRRASEDLRQREARLQLALDAAQMGTFVWYPPDDRGETDARTLALYGLNPADALNHARGLNELVVPEDRAEHAARVARALDPAGDGLLRSEYRIHRASDGAQRWIATLAQTQFAGEPPVPIVITGVCADVTASKQAATALLEKEQRQAFLLKLSDALRPLSDSAHIERTAMQVLGQELGVNRTFFATIDADGESWSIRHDYTKDVASQVGRYPMSQFQRSRLPQWQAGRMSSVTDSETDAGLSASDRAAYAVWGARAAIGVPLVKGGRFAALLSVNQTGPRTWTEAELALTREAAERIWVSIERSLAEEALQASQKRFESIANLVPDLLWDSAPDGVTNWYNQRWLEYTGQRFEEAIGWGWLEAIHPDGRETSAKRYGEAVVAGTSLQQEHRIRRYDGAYRWFVVSASPLKDQTGQVVKIYGAATDIHESKLAQAALRQSEEQYRQLSAQLEEQVQERTQELERSVEELKRSNDNLQQFAYVASHDLQEPLRKIQQFGDLLKAQYTEPAGDGFIYLERMQSAAHRMSVLIKDLLNYARIATQRDSSTAVTLNEVVTGILTDLEMLIEETQARIEVGALPVVEGDARQLGQLLQNLLSNALKFRQPGVVPRIAIKASRLAAEHLPEGINPSRRAIAYHRIEVADNGIGFDEKYLDRIFQVFQQLHGKSAYTGTGIGLAICEKVVANHGGAITATSGLNQGATFSVYLPV